MKTSCIQHPKDNRYIQLHQWQIDFCEGNHCAALLLSFFSGWHDWKLNHDQYYKRVNDIAEMHGDKRTHSENAFLFFSTDQLIEGCLGLFARKAINAGLELLVQLNVISIHQNPISRYNFDKTRYFRFYPEICNQWLTKDHLIIKKSEKTAQANDNADMAKRADPYGQKGLPSNQKAIPFSEKAEYIRTNTTNNTTNKINSINARENYFPEQSIHAHNQHSPAVQSVVNVLKECGMAEKHFNYPDVYEHILKLSSAGATSDDFISAFQRAQQFTEHGFGIKYLVPIVESILANRKNSMRINQFKTRGLCSDVEINYGESSPLPDWAKN